MPSLIKFSRVDLEKEPQSRLDGPRISFKQKSSLEPALLPISHQRALYATLQHASEACVTRPLVEIALLQIMAETGQLIPRKGWNFCEGKTTLKVPISAKRGIPHCQADLVRQAMPVVINYNINNSLKLKS